MTKRISDEELLHELQLRFAEEKNYNIEIDNLNAELKSINHKLEESESLKSHFISNVANEIINPFTSIIGLSKAILSVDKENWKKVVSMVALIHSEAFNLDFQLRNIFMAAKIEAGEATPEIFKVDVNNIIENVIESFRIELKKKRITLNYHFEGSKNDFIFKTDPDKIKLVMANLISNAIKFSFEDGTIEISANHSNQMLNIEVVDHGIGLSESSKRNIFDRFNRIDSEINSNNPGHGLGLSITKAIIDMLNGKIAVTSQIGNGSCFSLNFQEMNVPTSGYAPDANETFFDGDGETEIF